MVVYENLNKIIKIKDSILTVGTFDGLHKGHSTIFNEMDSLANDDRIKVALSFNPHPKKVLNTKQEFELLISKEKKIELFKKSNIDILVLIPFDLKFSKMIALDFLKNIIIDFFNPSIILVGHDHRFGYKRKGDFKFLQSYENDCNYKTVKVNPYSLDEEVVSSTLIRNYIKNYKLDLANKMLGWNYEISGKVIKGNGIGKKMNFPTANIKVDYKKICLPSVGVYAIRVKIDGNKYKGMCNIGYRPTFDALNEPIIEANIFHIFRDDFYGKNITIIFDRFIRKEKKFDSINDLVDQLKLDKEKVLK